MTLLLFGALCLRASGAALRAESSRMPTYAVGWVFCTVAAWMAIGAAGAWFPIWPALALGLVGALVDLRLNRRAVRTGADIIVVGLAGLFSIPPLDTGPLMGTVIAVAVGGYAVDSFMVRFEKPVQVATLVLLLLAGCVTLGVRSGPLPRPRMFAEGLIYMGLMPILHIGLAPSRMGKRIVLETGAVAWLEYPPGKGPFPGALFFHGANHEGSRQPAATIVRRALVDSGFVVLAVDHPGYGESPTPRLSSDPGLWDPLPTARAAVKTLRSRPDVDRIFALGHSMGAADVLRLLSVEPNLDGAVLLGASPGGNSSEYWYRRFHTDRQMNHRISRELFRNVKERYYNRLAGAQSLSSNHPPILFVRFGIEHNNIVATRDVLYAAIPSPKTSWDLPNSTHYLSSFSYASVVVGDTLQTRTLASRLRLLANHTRP